VTDRYRLPATLGGAEYPGIADGHGFVMLDIPDTGPVRFPADVVTRVVPPEPHDGQLVIVHTDDDPDGLGLLFSRHDEYQGVERGEFHWFDRQSNVWCDWDHVVSLGVPRRLVFGGVLAAENGRRGMCGSCKTLRTLRTDGMVPVHYVRARRCAGSQEPPLLNATAEARS